MAPATHGHNIIIKVLEKSTVVDKTLANGTRVREELVMVGDKTGCMHLHARDGKDNFVAVVSRFCYGLSIRALWRCLFTNRITCS